MTYTTITTNEFVTKLFAGERDFNNIKLENADLAGHEAYSELQEYLLNQDLKAEPILLQNAQLEGLQAPTLYLPFTNLTRANLAYAKIRRAFLCSANLTEADLTLAYLERADLTRANLQKANLERADLYGADLTRANLTEANLERATLCGVKGLETARHLDTVYCKNARVKSKEAKTLSNALLNIVQE